MCVVFNNVSKHSYSTKEAIKYGLLEAVNTAVNESANSLDSENELVQEEVTSDEYGNIYKENLIEALEEFYKDSMSRAEIVAHVEDLFPTANFYFFQMREGEDDMMKEYTQIEKFIADNIDTPRMSILSGRLEPVHLQRKERDIMVNGMQETIQKC